MSFTVIIPARYGSSRFPGKPLALIHGKPMIQHVFERSQKAGANRVIIATDDNRIGDLVQSFGGDVCYTKCTHESGTERLAEVIEIEEIPANEVVVNVQGDEPFIPVANISQVAKMLIAQPNANVKMATLCFPISNRKEIDNPNIVKVTFAKNGKALYFSRAPIPFDRNWVQNTQSMASKAYYRHVGIYAYTAGFVSEYINLESSHYESIESLEQLRVLYHGYDIQIAEANEAPPHGVDTPEDLAAFN